MRWMPLNETNVQNYKMNEPKTQNYLTQQFDDGSLRYGREKEYNTKRNEMLLRNDCAHITKNLLLVCKGTEQCKSELTKLQLTHSRSDSLTKCPNDQKTNERTIHHIKYIGRGYGKYTNLPSTLTLQFLPSPLLLSNTDHPQQPSYTKSLAK